MKIKLILLFIFICTVGFLRAANLLPYSTPIPKHALISKQITTHVAQKLLAEKNLHLIGSGGQMMEEVKILRMKFDYPEEVDLSAARSLITSAIECYLNEINQNQEIRKYLKNYPFTARNIQIGIYIHKPDGSDVHKDKLYYISAINGILYYYINDPKNQSRIIFHQETYAEALKTTLGINPKIKLDATTKL